MWGIIPAAGKGSRIQPLAFSKELLPVSREGEAHPRAVSDYLIERLVRGGAKKLCFVISRGKSDILEYYGGSAHSAAVCYAVQPEPVGLCDAIFRAIPFVDLSAPVLIGLPDTIWFPANALSYLPPDQFSFLLFPVEQPQYFDAVITGEEQRVVEVQVKSALPDSKWIWGAMKMPGQVLKELYDLWEQRHRSDEYLGTLVNAWLRQGGRAYGIRAGTSYLDVGTLDGYVNTLNLLRDGIAERTGLA
jgi:dTDP-glucose pyrophosphorylase